MAFGRLERSGLPQPMSDINMTPLIDVMLVLLVIFMITAPLMTSSLKLDLPQAAGATAPAAVAQVNIAIDPQGALFWGDEPVTPQQLVLRVREAAQRDAAIEVQLRADETVAYGRIAELIGLVQTGGLSRFALLTEARAEPATPSR